MDGAGRLRTLCEIVLPLAAPGHRDDGDPDVSLLLERVLFALSFTLGPERYTVPVAIALFRGQYQVPWGEILAAAIVASRAGGAARARRPAPHRRGPHRRRGEGLRWRPSRSRRR